MLEGSLLSLLVCRLRRFRKIHISADSASISQTADVMSTAGAGDIDVSVIPYEAYRKRC